MPVELPSSRSSTERKRVKGRKRGGNLLLTKLVVGWCLFLAVLIFGARLIWKDTGKPERPAVHTDATSTISETDFALLEKSGPQCNEVLFKFLSAGTPEERNQFVLSPVITAGRMARYYASNPVAVIDPQKLSLIAQAVVHLPGRTMIETQWKSADGKLFDAAFAEENDEWRLDWDHYARYSNESWNLFVAGHGSEDGEFRVLAREPLADERKGSESIGIVLYEPRFGYANDIGQQSPQFLLKRDSEDGRLLEAAFKLEKAGKRVYNPDLPRIDPKDLIRLRVKVRSEAGGPDGHLFKIEKIVAAHWYSLDDAGVK